MTDGGRTGIGPVGYVVVPEGVLKQRVADETVLLHLGDGMYYGLDAVGTRMLELACGEGDLDTIIAQLQNEYDASAATLRHDFEALMAELTDKGLVLRAAPSDLGADRDAGSPARTEE